VQHENRFNRKCAKKFYVKPLTESYFKNFIYILYVLHFKWVDGVVIYISVYENYVIHYNTEICNLVSRTFLPLHTKQKSISNTHTTQHTLQQPLKWWIHILSCKWGLCMRECVPGLSDTRNVISDKSFPLSNTLLGHVPHSPIWVLAPSTLWTDLNSMVFEVGLSAPLSNPKAGDQGLYFVCSLLFDLFGMGGSTRSLRSRQYSSPDH
jgi:hypothetical protein